MLQKINQLLYAIITTPFGRFFADKAEVQEKDDGSSDVHFKRFNDDHVGTINIDPSKDLIEEEKREIIITKQNGEQNIIKFF